MTAPLFFFLLMLIVPFGRIGTVEPSDENKTNVNIVKDEFVLKKRVRISGIF